MYLPPQLDAKEGVFGNQLLTERNVVESLHLEKNSTVLEIGCGRGRIAHHVARLSDAKVCGINLDGTQIQEAKDYAEKTGFSDRLEFKVGNSQKRFEYADGTFDGIYTIQGLHGFTTLEN